MNVLKPLPLFLMVATLIGCISSSPKISAPKPTEELFVVFPRGLPIECGDAVRKALESYIELAPVDTPIICFLAGNQELLGSMIIPEGSNAYRRKVAKKKLSKVFERLDPEMSGGSQAIDLISIPASIRKYRKSQLNPRVILIGSPLIVDREQGNSISCERIPCDGCVTDSKSSYGKMETFPKGTTVSGLHPRADYGNGPNHRAQVEHFLRYLLQEKNGPLIRLSSDAEVVFNTTKSQWDDTVGPEDECTGSKAVVDDEAKKILYDVDGKTKIVEIAPDLSIKIRKPEEGLLKGVKSRVLFLPDISGSVAWDPDGNDRSEVFNAIKTDLCEKLHTMRFTHFAICGFGGRKDLSPRLSKYPNSMFSGLYWAEATRENRDEAIKFVRELKAEGGTPTLAALEEASKLEGPLTCILYSDGVPTLGDGGQVAVLALAKMLAQKRVTVNTVGVGTLSAQNEDFDWSGGEFLARLAKVTFGEYFVLEE